LPRSTDLSYYNWETQVAHATSSPNFQVITDNEMGLLFKNKRDRKIINVDPEVRDSAIIVRGGSISMLWACCWQVPPGDNTTRTELDTHEYVQVVIFDHMTRRKA